MIPFQKAGPLPSDELIAEALKTCADEPIHITGSVQPHGLLIAMTPTGTILRASANMEFYLGRTAESVLGQPIADLLGRAQAERLYHAVPYNIRQPIRSTIFEIETPSGFQRFDAVTHFSGEQLVLELEPQDSSLIRHEFEFFYDELRDFSVTMREAASLDDLHQHVVDNIRLITGFDRVKLYRFDADWNGEVIAESRAGHMPSYLGQHFPNSDIPEQARKLYTKNYLRLIVDLNYQPVPIVSQSEAMPPLDLSLSVLRSVSPVHVKYLANMGVAASLSVSIIQNETLWGMVACHHNSAKHVPYRIRMIAELMGHIFSAQLSTFQEMQRKDMKQKRTTLLQNLAATLETNFQPMRILDGRAEIALEALDAQGVAVQTGEALSLYGETPVEREVENIIAWLKKHHPDSPFHTHDMPSAFEGVEELEHVGGGLLATPVGQRTGGYVLWFRQAEEKSIHWAGKPVKDIERQESGVFRLSPRGSFELWRETVQGRSTPWQPEEIAMAQDIVSIVLESEKLSATQASAAKSEFLANMSHELRTPMNAVIGITNILAKSVPLTRDQKEFISTLQISSHSLLGLINDLLDISKIESRSMALENEPFNFCSIIEDVRSLMAVRAAEKRLHLNISYPKKQECHFLGDGLRVRQIVLNLLSNAIKFTEHGFVNLSMRVKPFQGDENHRTVQIDVSDTGIGMTDAQTQRIFDKFVQADSSISRRFGGTGLGLSITKHLIELMGGTITVVSKDGMGSKFSVLLTLEAHSVPEEEVPCALQENAREGEWKSLGKVLLTEDYEGNIMVALTYLQDLGYEVVVARNGKEALDKMAREKFDVILMDVQMPVMDGYTATQTIRENGNKIPIIGMTAHALAGDRDKCIDAGMDDYISKPFSLDELQSKLEQYVAQSRAGREVETSSAS